MNHPSEFSDAYWFLGTQYNGGRMMNMWQATASTLPAMVVGQNDTHLALQQQIHAFLSLQQMCAHPLMDFKTDNNVLRTVEAAKDSDEDKEPSTSDSPPSAKRVCFLLSCVKILDF
ncbi:unnamed protein product [Caenorhabditis bovis]|uniref:Uncharacterized protein n=1 Tax=Caenorhabditis bovis TaxID=2654633 RepID=A0A8S1F887_9PELO|nr:unnamed protein product [Caenorhabditis bovis]